MYGFWVMKHDRQNQNFEKVKKHWRNYHLSPPPTIQKIKTLEKWKNYLQILSFTHVYHKWQSYDVWLLRYGARPTELFVILDHFLSFYPSPPTLPPPLATQKIKILKNEKNAWRYHNFTKLYQKSWSYATLLLRYNVWLLFFALFPLNNPKNKLKKKKMLGDIKIHMCNKSHDHMMYSSWDMVCYGWTNRQMDGWKKWHTVFPLISTRGAC